MLLVLSLVPTRRGGDRFRQAGHGAAGWTCRSLSRPVPWPGQAAGAMRADLECAAVVAQGWVGGDGIGLGSIGGLAVQPCRAGGGEPWGDVWAARDSQG